MIAPMIAQHRVVRLQRHLRANPSSAAAADGVTWRYGGEGHEPLFEFAQREWCERAAVLGVALLKNAAASVSVSKPTDEVIEDAPGSYVKTR